MRKSTTMGSVSVLEPKMVSINRGRFNPETFIGPHCSIVSKETDVRSAALTELDLNQVDLVTVRRHSVAYLTGEERLKRLRTAKCIRLDADIFFTLWENKALIPSGWKEKVNDHTRRICFDGTVFQASESGRCILSLYWSCCSWSWDLCSLEKFFNDNDPSAVLHTAA